MRRIDKINSYRTFCCVLLCLALYYSIAEAALETSVFSNASNESDYYASIIFSENDWKTALKFRRDLFSIGERRVVVPGTLFYKYKHAKTESFTINSHGFRGNEIKPKEKDEFRIVIFGESRIFGLLLAEENTIPAVLENSLRKAFPDKNIKVLNLSVEGLTFQQIEDLAKYHYKELEPDIILFYSIINDINEAYIFGNVDRKPYKENEILPPAFGAKPDEKLTMKVKLLNTIKLAFINDFSKVVQTFTEADLPSVPVPPDKLEIADAFIRIFPKKVEDACSYFQEQGIYTAYVLPPIIQVKRPLSEIETHLLFRQESFVPGLNLFARRCEEGLSGVFAEKRNFNVIDQTKIFNGSKETLFYDGMHFTPEGSRMSAEGLSEKLVVIIEEMQNKNAQENR